MKAITMKLSTISSMILIGVIMIGCGENTEENSKEKKPDKDNIIENDSLEADPLTIETDTMAIDTAVEAEPLKEVLGQEEKAQAAEATRKVYDLSDYGFNMTIGLPTGTKLEYDEDYEELTMNFGQDFTMVLGENYDGTIAEIKGKFKNTMHNQHLGYIKDTPNGIIKKSKANGIITHSLFYTVDEANYILKSVPSKTYSQAEAMEMWKAAESLKMK